MTANPTVGLRSANAQWKKSHVFISYVRDDKPIVDRLCEELGSRGIDYWRDEKDIPIGSRWKHGIARAIQSGSFFLACFSEKYHGRDKTYMNEELILAVEELRKRPTDRAWFLPVLLSNCEIPERSIGGGETLRDIQAVSLFENWNEGIQRIISAITV
jgi:hypothetical protein